jgi:hypothetical protein
MSQLAISSYCEYWHLKFLSLLAPMKIQGLGYRSIVSSETFNQVKTSYAAIAALR